MIRVCCLFLLPAFAAVVPGLAATRTVGVATSASPYSVNQSEVRGRTSLPEGSALRTRKSEGEITLENGADVRLSHKSAGTIYRDRMVLENGSVQISKFNGYPVDVRSLRIHADDPDAEATIRTHGSTVEIASAGNGVRVMSGTTLLTRVEAGTRMAFRQQGSMQSNDSATQQYPKLSSDRHVLYWLIGIIAGTAIICGSIAIAQGKSL